MREFTVENNGVNTNLVYEVKEKETVDSVILGMMENNRINGLLSMTYTQMDTKKYLKYNITSKVTIEQFFERQSHHRHNVFHLFPLATYSYL